MKKLISKYIAFLNKTAISWFFECQTTILESLYKAKYITVSKIVKEFIKITCFLKKLYLI